MICLNRALSPSHLRPKLERLFELSGAKIRSIAEEWNPANGTPVFTVKGKYVSQGWTEWTEGLLYGSALLQFDATGEPWFLDYGRSATVDRMAAHVADFGVHDHGFNNVSTYGNLLRLGNERKFELQPFERDFYKLALKMSGAIQAARWTRISDGRGYIYSFSGPHSLFADTVRSLRSLALAHRLGQSLTAENGRRISLLERLAHHASVTAEFSVYYGEGRDAWDVRGRVAHESLFNTNDGSYRCPSSQQGYSPFSTWTRGLAWIVCGYAEELEFLSSVSDAELDGLGGRAALETMMLRAALATSDYYIEEAAQDGIPYWDTAAPNLAQLRDRKNKSSDPFNGIEPVDSSAAAIAAQGLWRLARFLDRTGRDPARAEAYRLAALAIANTLFAEPYLSTERSHQGLILHAVYHRPNGWDFVPPGSTIPHGESCLWGDYHARELALILLREARQEPYFTFFDVGL